LALQIFNTATGRIPEVESNVWDRECGTFKNGGVHETRPAETLAHNLTGDIVAGALGKPQSMTQDPDGVSPGTPLRR
jgi:hypothetical protein